MESAKLKNCHVNVLASIMHETVEHQWPTHLEFPKITDKSSVTVNIVQKLVLSDRYYNSLVQGRMFDCKTGSTHTGKRRLSWVLSPPPPIKSREKANFFTIHPTEGRQEATHFDSTLKLSPPYKNSCFHWIFPVWFLKKITEITLLYDNRILPNHNHFSLIGKF